MRQRVGSGLLLLCLISAHAAAQFPNDFKFGDDLTGTDFSIGGWFNASVSQGTDAALISNKNWDSGGNPGFVLTVNSDQTWKTNVAADSRADTTWTPFSLSQWTYVVATFDRNGDVTAYTNGGTLAGGSQSVATMPAGSVDTFASPSFLDFNIGQDGTGVYSGGNGNSFRGLVDEVAIWRRALSPQEVSDIFTSGQALGSIISSTPSIGDNLVAYYPFNGSLADAQGTNNGVLKTNGGTTIESYGAGLFGQSYNFDGFQYVTIGESVSPADANFTGNSAADNLASNAGNWDLAPASWTTDTGLVIGPGTSATFGGANTGPVVFDGTFGQREVKSVTLGADGVTTYAAFNNSPGGSANLLGVGGSNSVIGTPGSNVQLTMTGSGRLEHRGSEEEGSEMVIGREGATVNIAISGTAELTAGPRVADPAFATGFRRPITTDPPGTPPRTGDDIKLGDDNDLRSSAVTVTMNNDAVIFAPDVLYPGDSNKTLVNVVQNDNSQVIANWDARWLDDGGNSTVNWTMNGNSRFLVARDHGLGETAGDHTVNLTVNDHAEFRAGDRIALGADGGNVNVTINGGLMKVGGDSASQVILVDETGTDANDIARDWILHMGGGANAKLNVNGGRVEVGRSAYIGRGGGTAVANVNGGVFDVKGVGPIGTGLGNGPGGGVPTNVDWTSNGGDLIVGDDAGDQGSFNFQSGTVTIARDVVIGYDNNFDNTGADGTLTLTSGAGGSMTVGRDLSFAGDFFAASGGSAHLNVVFEGSTLSPVDVNGDLYIYNSGSSTSDFSLSVTGIVPSVGQYVLIDYAGTRGPGGTGAGMFTELPSPGITYNLIYDDTLGQVRLNITAVTLIDGDFNNDGFYTCIDVNDLVTQIASGSNNPAYDLNSDNLVNTTDLNLWLVQGGANNPAQTGGNPFLLGDANLDGTVDGQDFIEWNTHKFTNVPAWCSGDFTADGVVDGQDFIVWNSNKFMSSDSASAAVPEPSSAVAVLLLLGVFGLRRRLT